MPTGLLEDTIVDDPEATSLEEEEESASDGGVETDVEEPNPYEGKTREEIDALIAKEREDAEARARKSEADRVTAQLQKEQFERDRKAAQSLLTGQAKQQIADAIAQHQKEVHKAWEANEDPPEINAEWFDRVVGTITNGIRNLDTNEWVSSANAYFAQSAPQGWEAPKDLVARAELARGIYGKQGWLEAALAIAEALGEQKGIEKGKAAAAEDQTVKALEQKNGRQPGPTGSGNGKPPDRDPIAALNEPGISWEERKARWKVAYPDVPFPTRF